MTIVWDLPPTTSTRRIAPTTRTGGSSSPGLPCSPRKKGDQQHPFRGHHHSAKRNDDRVLQKGARDIAFIFATKFHFHFLNLHPVSRFRPTSVVRSFTALAALLVLCPFLCFECLRVDHEAYSILLDSSPPLPMPIDWANPFADSAPLVVGWCGWI